MRKSLAVFLFAAFAVLIAGPASAANIYFQFSGNNAAGNINGAAFSGKSWLLEFAVDGTAVDSQAPSYFAIFTNSVTGGHIAIDGTVYELGGASAMGQVTITDSSKLGVSGYYDQVVIHPASGGYMDFITGDNTLFPAVFADNNDLATASFGISVTNSIADAFNNASALAFANSNSLLGAGGEIIHIVESSLAASGGVAFMVSATSFVPEPSSFVIAAFGLIGLTTWGWRQKS